MLEKHINLQSLEYYEEELEKILNFISKKESKYRKQGCLLYSDHVVLSHSKVYFELIKDRICYLKSK